MKNYDDDREISTSKTITWAIGVGIIAIILSIFVASNIHRNDIQEFTVVQTIGGKTFIRDTGGYFWSFFPKKWNYRKVTQVYFSNEKDESKDNDGIIVRFKNKGTGDISCQVVD